MCANSVHGRDHIDYGLYSAKYCDAVALLAGARKTPVGLHYTASQQLLFSSEDSTAPPPYYIH